MMVVEKDERNELAEFFGHIFVANWNSIYTYVWKNVLKFYWVN